MTQQHDVTETLFGEPPPSPHRRRRDIHRHPFARQAIDRLRLQRVDVLVVDMGWPSEDRRYADVATFGASRLMGRALLEWLAATA